MEKEQTSCRTGRLGLFLPHCGKSEVGLIETWEVFKTIPPPPDQYSLTGRAVKVTCVNWLKKCDMSERGQKIISSYLWHGVM